jgi:hypothetical protein
MASFATKAEQGEVPFNIKHAQGHFELSDTVARVNFK